MEGHPDHAGRHLLSHLGTHLHFSPPRADFHVFTLINAQFLCICRGDIRRFFRENQIHAGTARLGAGMIVEEAAARAEHEGIFRIRHFRGRRPVHGIEDSFSVGEDAVAVQEGRPRMIFRRAGPLEAVRFNPAVFDAAQGWRQNGHFVVPDFLGTAGSPFLSHAFGQFLEDPPVGSSITRRGFHRADAVDATLTAGERSVILAPRGGRENHMSKAGRFRGEDILADEKFRGCQLVFHLMDVRFRIGQIFSEDVKGPDGLVHQPLHHLGDHQPVVFRQLLDAPGLFKFGPGSRIDNLLIAGEDVGQGAHIAGTLDVVLTAQGIHAGGRHSQVPQQELEIGRAHHVVLPGRVFRDPQGVAEHRRFH